MQHFKVYSFREKESECENNVAFSGFSGNSVRHARGLAVTIEESFSLHVHF